MTSFKIGIVDVYVVRPYRDEWLVLTLQRALGTRCPGSWEAVHGSIEDGERPGDAAVREVREESRLAIDRLYNLTTHSIYLEKLDEVRLAISFCAFVTEDASVRLSEEHQRYEWLSMADAATRFTWPRAREALHHIRILLGTGDAGPVEDVLRVI
jgi:8-oxo-dGTP pyrophosphatase MutT (NUDIX family)